MEDKIKEIFSEILEYVGSRQKFCVINEEHCILIDCDDLLKFLNRLKEKYEQ